MRPGLLFICGSLDQTTMLHRIAGELAEFDCFFTPFYADGLAGALSQTGLLDFSILGGRHFAATRGYLEAQRLPVDFGGRRCNYDAVVTCTDLLVQKNIRGRKLILVQEGMTEPDSLAYRLVRSLGLPRWIANTAATGLSNAYDVFCVASEGYRDFFAGRGVKRKRWRSPEFPILTILYLILGAISRSRIMYWWRHRAFVKPASQTTGAGFCAACSRSQESGQWSSNCIRMKTSTAPDGRSARFFPTRPCISTGM